MPKTSLKDQRSLKRLVVTFVRLTLHNCKTYWTEFHKYLIRLKFNPK